MLNAKSIALGVVTAGGLIALLTVVFQARATADAAAAAAGDNSTLTSNGTVAKLTLEEACMVVTAIDDAKILFPADNETMIENSLNPETDHPDPTSFVGYEVSHGVLEICASIQEQGATWETAIQGLSCDKNGEGVVDMTFDDLFIVYEDAEDLVNSYGLTAHTKQEYIDHALAVYCNTDDGLIDFSDRRLLETHGGPNHLKMVREVPEEMLTSEDGDTMMLDENGRRLVVDAEGKTLYAHDEEGRKLFYDHEEGKLGRRRLLSRRSSEVGENGRVLWGGAVTWVVKQVTKVAAAVVCAIANWASEGDFCGQVKAFIQGVAGGLTKCVVGWDDTMASALLSWSISPIETWWAQVMTCVETKIMNDYRTGVFTRNEEASPYTPDHLRKYQSLREPGGIDNVGNGRRNGERIVDPSCANRNMPATTPPRCTTKNGKLKMNWNPTASGTTDPKIIRTAHTSQGSCPSSDNWYWGRYCGYWRGYCSWHGWVQAMCRRTCAQHLGRCRTTTTYTETKGSTMGSDTCLSSNQLKVRKASMIKLSQYAAQAQDVKGEKDVPRSWEKSEGTGWGQVNCISGWSEHHQVKWDYMVDGKEYSLPIIEPCSAQAGLDFDFVMCDGGRVDDATLYVNSRDPRFGDALQMLGWGNLAFHGLCTNDFGGPLDTGPMSYMFLYLLSEIDQSHSNKDSWTIGGVNGGQRYTRQKLQQDMDLFFHVMDDYEFYPSNDLQPGIGARWNDVQKFDPSRKYKNGQAPFGGYSVDWMRNMRRIDDIAGGYMDVIPTFVKRAVGLCIPNCPGIVHRFGYCDDYDNFMFGTIKDILNQYVSGFGDIMQNYNNYPIGSNRLSYNFEGCKLLLEGGIRFANAFVVQNDGPNNNLFMVGRDRPPIDATCDLQYHSRWHWRAGGVMRAFLRMAQVARGHTASGDYSRMPTVPYRGQGTH